MNSCYEQNVAACRKLKSRLLYFLCWVWIVLLLMAALLFLANLFENDPAVFTVNWLNGIGALMALSFAGLIFVRKDYLHMEYDYILSGSELTICGIMNQRRRKQLASFDLRSVLQAGRFSESVPVLADESSPMRRHRWYAENCRYYIVYTETNIRHVALLELDETLAALVRRQLPTGAWHGEEGKMRDAGISGQ